MKNLLIAIFLAVAALPATAATQKPPLDPEKCADLAKQGENGKGRLDVVVFDHSVGQVVWPAPAKLSVPDEGIFVVVFTNTDSTKFDYSIKSLDPDESKAVDLKADGKGVTTKNDHIVCVSWQHHEEFSSYRVSITRRIEAEAKVKTGTGNKKKTESEKELDQSVSGVDQDERLLFPYTFPIWIETSGAQLSFSTGLGFSTLTSPRFFIKTDDHGTKDTNDDTQIVGRDHNGRDSFRPDVMAFATLNAPHKKSWFQRLGLTVGLGIGDNSSPRYFLGTSLVLSRRMVVSFGAIGAQVKRLPAGQELGKAPINGANTLNQLDSGFKIGGGLSISMKVGKDREKFLGVFNPPQKIPETPKETKEPTEKKPEQH